MGQTSSQMQLEEAPSPTQSSYSSDGDDAKLPKKHVDNARDSSRANGKRKRTLSHARDGPPRSPSPMMKRPHAERTEQATRPAKRKRTEEEKKDEKRQRIEEEKKDEKPMPKPKKRKRPDVEDSPAPVVAIEVRVDKRVPSDSEGASIVPPKPLKESESHSKPTERKAQPPPKSRTSTQSTTPAREQSKQPSSQPDGDGQAAPKRGHVSQSNKYLTGFFTPDEVQTLEHYKVDFCNTNAISAETFDRMVQHSRRDRKDEFPCDSTIITKEEFWRNIYELLPERDRRSVYRFMRRHFQASTQKSHQWSQEQEDELAQLHRIHGPKWALIAKELGRTHDDVVQRWKNKVEHRGTMKRGPWSAEEVRKLQDVLTLVRDTLAEAGKDVGRDIYEMDESYIGWGTVSDFIKNTRSRQQCADKWRKIKRIVTKLRANGNPDAVYDPSMSQTSKSQKESRSESRETSPPKPNGRSKRKPKSARYVNSDDDSDDDDNNAANSVTPTASNVNATDAASYSRREKQETTSVPATETNGVEETDDDSDGEESNREETESTDDESSGESPPTGKPTVKKSSTTQKTSSSQQRRAQGPVNKEGSGINKKASSPRIVYSSTESSSEGSSSESKDEGKRSQVSSKARNSNAAVESAQDSDDTDNEEDVDSGEELGAASGAASESGSESESESESGSASSSDSETAITTRIPNELPRQQTITSTQSHSSQSLTHSQPRNSSPSVKSESDSEDDGINPRFGDNQSKEGESESDDSDDDSSSSNNNNNNSSTSNSSDDDESDSDDSLKSEPDSD